MAGVSGVSVTNKYSDRELDGLAGHENDSTQAVVSTISKHSGATYDVNVRGRDPTAAEVKAAHQDKVTDEWGHALVSEGGDSAVEHGVDHVVDGAGLLLLPVTLIRAGVEMTKAVVEDHEAGLDRTNAASREVLHAFVLGNINGLPQDYMDAQMARFSDGAKHGQAAEALRKRLGDDGDHAQMAKIQLHADQGMLAARAALEAKMPPADYLRTHPEAAKRYQSDPAFRHGFDGLVYAADKGKATYDAAIASLDGRTKVYGDHHVQVRL